MVSKNLEWHGHEVRTELRNGPDDSETFQFSGGVGLLSLVERPRDATDDPLLALTDLRQYCAEACSRCVGVKTKGLSKVGKGGDGTGGEECFQVVEGILAVSAPMEDCILPGQRMQWAGDCCEIFHITPVIRGKTQEGTDFSGGFGRRNLPDGREERWIRQEALFRNPVPQITDLLGGESAFFSAKFEVRVSQPLEDLPKMGEVFLPCGGEHDDVIKVEETRFPVETREDAIYEAGEGGRGVTEAKRDLVEFVQLPTAGTKCRLLLIRSMIGTCQYPLFRSRVENQ